MQFTEEISVSGGKIKGEYIDGRIAAFKGIPYAAPPVGALRFQPPQPAQPWEGTLECTRFGKSAPQNRPDPENSVLWTREFLITNMELSEDCLTLNLWADLKAESPMPVIVYMYGGGLVSGGSSCEIYDGCTLARHGVIYVTFNHREGTLGLLSHEKLDETSATGTSGNYLLMDELAALRWVKENIAAFGGDPENITLMGQSSGAMGVNALSVSPLAKGLFKRSISMSWNSYIGKRFGEAFVDKASAQKEAEDVLSAHGRTADELFTMKAEEFASDPKVRQISVDGHVLDMDFKSGVDSGRTNEIITVAGMVPGDGLIQSPFAEMFRGGVKITETGQIQKIMADLLADEYPAFEAIYDVENRDPLTVKKEIEEDFLICSMLWFAEGRRKAGASAPAYLYYYTHVLPGPMANAFGAFHSSELPYFFNKFSDFRKDYWKEEDFALGEYLCGDLAKFVREDEVSDLEKTPEDGYSYFRIEAGQSCVCRMDEAKRALWFSCFKNL